MEQQKEYPKMHHFEALGQDAYYDEIMPWLETLYDRYLQDEDEHYLVAVNEAVCNAARYAKAGYDCVQILVDVKISWHGIETSVTADTIPFDVESFYRKMKDIAKLECYKHKDWGEYTEQSDKSRGYWLMLMPCRSVCIDISGKTVTLYADRPFSPECLSKKICTLVNRLHIVKGANRLEGGQPSEAD